MKLNQLLKAKKGFKKRLGRGIGSGLGKTAGRGTKGQKARGKIPAGFSGSGLPLYKKLPLKKGYGNRSIFKKKAVINLSDLSIFKSKTIIDIEQLINAKLISKKDVKKGVKLLGGGEILSALTIKLPVSKLAQKKIEKIGGKVLNV